MTPINGLITGVISPPYRGYKFHYTPLITGRGPCKTNMTIEKQPFEDVSPLQFTFCLFAIFIHFLC